MQLTVAVERDTKSCQNGSDFTNNAIHETQNSFEFKIVHGEICNPRLRKYVVWHLPTLIVSRYQIKNNEI